MNKIVICLSTALLAFVLFQKHQQDQRRDAYKAHQALIDVSSAT